MLSTNRVLRRTLNPTREGKGIGGCIMRGSTIYTLTFPELLLVWLTQGRLNLQVVRQGWRYQMWVRNFKMEILKGSDHFQDLKRKREE
jgi:hypothetical protein